MACENGCMDSGFATSRSDDQAFARLGFPWMGPVLRDMGVVIRAPAGTTSSSVVGNDGPGGPPVDDDPSDPGPTGDDEPEPADECANYDCSLAGSVLGQAAGKVLDALKKSDDADTRGDTAGWIFWRQQALGHYRALWVEIMRYKRCCGDGGNSSEPRA